MEKSERLNEILESLIDSDLIEIHNNYCEKNKYDNQVYPMCMLDDMIGYGKTPTEILEELDDGFRVRDKYFWYHDLYGARSANDISDLPIEINDLSEYILDNSDSLGNSDIQDFLDEIESEGDENE